MQQRAVAHEREPERRREQPRRDARSRAGPRSGRQREERRGRGQQRQPERAGPVHLRHVCDRERDEDRERRERGECREAPAAPGLVDRHARVDGAARARARQREQRRDHGRPEQRDHSAREPMQTELGRLLEAPLALERERRPVVAVVPDDHRREERERDERREIRLRPREPGARAPVGEHEEERAGAEQRDRVLREHPGAETDADPPPRARPRLDEREPQEVERPRPGRGEWRVGSHQDPAGERERQRRDQRDAHRRRGLPEPARRERRREADRHERTRDRADAHAPLTVTEERGAGGDQPGHERRVVEIRQVQVLRVAPVVGLFGQELDGPGVGDSEREQVARGTETREAQRERALVRRARRREHEERGAGAGHGEREQLARNERGQRRETRVPQQTLERAAADQRRERRQRREARDPRAAKRARADSEGEERRRGRPGEVRGPEREAAALQEREDRAVDQRARGERETQAAQRRRPEVDPRERDQPPEILADLGDSELRLAARPIDELDRHLDHAQPRAAAREQLEQDLEARRFAAEREQVGAVRREVAGHRIARRGDRPGERRRDARGDLAPQRPAARRAARHVPASDREAGRAREHGSGERGDRRDRMREVRVHHHHDVAARLPRAGDHGTREAALAAAHDDPHRKARRPGERALRGPVLRVVVDDDHLERRARVGERADLPQQLVDVLDLVQRRDDDRERGVSHAPALSRQSAGLL